MKALFFVLSIFVQFVFASQSQSQHPGVGNVPFSGVYRPSLRFQPDDAVGAFLVPRTRFVSAVVPIFNTTSHKRQSFVGEAALESVIRAKCATCLNFLTRDFMDLFVEHLPSTIEQLDPSQRDAVVYLANSLKRTTKKLRLLAAPALNYDRRLNETIAVLVFNGDLTNRVSCKMKAIFFQATFWSVYRYYHNIVVVTKSAVDYATVMGLKVNALEVVNLDIAVDPATQIKPYPVRAAIIHGALIKGAVEMAALRLHSMDPRWRGFRYVYMSIADQLLHSRRFRDIYDTLDTGSEGNFLIAPHRMQTLPLAQNLPVELQEKLWPARGPSFDSSIEEGERQSVAGVAARTVSQRTPSAQWVPHATIVTERLLGVTSSCCEQGRVVFPACPLPSEQHLDETAVHGTGNGSGSDDKAANVTRSMRGASSRALKRSAGVAARQWTGCAEWGPRNFSTWLRVGPDGFAMPPVTVHLAYCEYSSTPRQCPVGELVIPATVNHPVSPEQLQLPCTQGLANRVPARTSTVASASSRPAAAASSSPGSLSDPSTSSNNPRVTLTAASSSITYHHCQESPSVHLNPYTVHLLSAESQQVLSQSKAFLRILEHTLDAPQFDSNLQNHNLAEDSHSTGATAGTSDNATIVVVDRGSRYDGVDTQVEEVNNDASRRRRDSYVGG